MLDDGVVAPALACSALLGWALIGAISFSGSEWPHAGLRGNLERAALFFVVAALTRASLVEHRTRWQIAAFVVAAIIFEIGRGRTAAGSNGLAGSLASTAGAIVGAVLLRHVAHTNDW